MKKTWYNERWYDRFMPDRGVSEHVWAVSDLNNRLVILGFDNSWHMATGVMR